MQTFVKKFDKNVKVAKACAGSPERKLKTLMRGRPLMVGPIIDERVTKFMVSLYKKGDHVSRSITTTTTVVLLSRTDDKSVEISLLRLHGKKSVAENWLSKASSDY